MRLVAIRRIVVAAVLLVACVGPPEPSSGPTGMADNPRGVLMNVAGTPAAGLDAMLERAREARLGWVRTDFFWDLIEPAPGSHRWEHYDAFVRAATRHSVAVLGILDYSARWASRDPRAKDDKHPPRRLEDFLGYVALTVARYRPAVQHWEIWNEPDHRDFWKGTAQEYAVLLAQAYRTVKAANPDAQVLLGGLAQGGDHDPAFLRAVLGHCRAAGEVCFDILAFHTNFRTLPQIRAQFEENRRTAAEHGIQRPIWVTESSYTSERRYQSLPGYDDGEAGHARYTVDSMRLSLQLGAARVIWAGLVDWTGEAATGPYSESGLLRRDGSPKAAFEAVRALAQQH